MHAAKRAVLVWLAVIASAMPARAAAAAGVSFSVSGPGEVRVDPGKTSTTTLTVRNPSDRTQNITIEITGLRVRNGQYDFPKQTSPGITVAATPRKFTLQPKSARDILIVVKASKSAKPGDASAGVIIRGVPPARAGSSPVAGEIGLPLFATVSGTTSDTGRIAGFRADLPVFGNAPFGFSIDFRNTGNIHYTPHGTIELFAAGKSLGTAPIEGAPILPGTTRTLHATWKADAPVGALRAIAHLLWGKNDHRKADAETTFRHVLGSAKDPHLPAKSSLWIPALLLLLVPVTGLLMFFLWRRRHDRRDEPPGDASVTKSPERANVSRA